MMKVVTTVGLAEGFLSKNQILSTPRPMNEANRLRHELAKAQRAFDLGGGGRQSRFAAWKTYSGLVAKAAQESVPTCGRYGQVSQEVAELPGFAVVCHICFFWVVFRFGLGRKSIVLLSLAFLQNIEGLSPAARFKANTAGTRCSLFGFTHVLTCSWQSQSGCGEAASPEKEAPCLASLLIPH